MTNMPVYAWFIVIFLVSLLSAASGIAFGKGDYWQLAALATGMICACIIIVFACCF